MKFIAALLCILSLVSTAAVAALPVATTFTCAAGLSAQAAIAAAQKSKGDFTFTLKAGGNYTMSGENFSFNGFVVPEGIPNAALTNLAGAAFADADVHVMKDQKGNDLAQAAFASNGTPAAYLLLWGGKYHLICSGDQDTSLQETASSVDTLPATAELSDAQKDDQQFARMPNQRAKEIQLLGKVSLRKPDEGHYDCNTTRFFSDGDKRTNKTIDSDDEHAGFDLFADGSVRLMKNDGTFEDGGSIWRHNAGSGNLQFVEGTLSVYFEWPIHVRRSLAAGHPEASILYSMDYDSDGAVDDLTLCIWAGAAKSKSPAAEVAEISERNLHPPPPGSTRISGLFYRQEWTPMIGPNFTMYQVDNYYYRYFQENGYVWLGGSADGGDFDALGCDKPIVDKLGQPLCTSYDIQDGFFSKPTVRIGNEEPVPFSQVNSQVVLNGTTYSLMAREDGRRLNRTLSYSGYNGIAMRQGYITFRDDGTYESSSSAGVLYTLEIPDVARTTVTGFNQGDELKGTYDIQGYAITFTSNSGKSSKMFFGYISEAMVIVGNQAYIERSK